MPEHEYGSIAYETQTANNPMFPAEAGWISDSASTKIRDHSHIGGCVMLIHPTNLIRQSCA